MTDTSDAASPGRLDREAMLAEFSALRAEIERRANIQWNVFALQLGAVGAVSALAISTASNVALLLLVPIVSYMLGSRYILHDFHIKLIRRYLRESLSPRLGAALQWEHWQRRELAARPSVSRRSAVAGWNVLHPTRLAFEGVAVMALVASASAAFFIRSDSLPRVLLLVGYGVAWSIGLACVVLMHRSFVAASTPDATAVSSSSVPAA